MASNADIEMRWIDAWNELADLIDGRSDVPCLLPDGSIVDIENCRGWLQESVYQSSLVRVEAGWVGRRRGVIARRFRETDTE